jgi:pyruvate kinase
LAPGKIFVVTPNRELEKKLSFLNNVYQINFEDYSVKYEDIIIERIKELIFSKKGEVFIVTSVG